MGEGLPRTPAKADRGRGRELGGLPIRSEGSLLQEFMLFTLKQKKAAKVSNT
jgi:hypothetical protein